MKLTNLHVDGFGVWSQLELNQLSDGVTVIFGANEAGKTTLMEFMRAVLYGLSDKQRQRYLPPVHGSATGGSLDIDSHLGRLRFTRSFNDSPHDSDRLRVTGTAGTELPRDRWRELLADVDEQTFQNVFAVGLRELQELGTLDDTEAAALLYKLSTGLDRVSLFDVMHDLSSSRRQLLDPSDRTGKIERLWAQRCELRKQLDDAAAIGPQWFDLQTQATELDQEISQLDEQRQQLREDLTIHEVATQAHGVWIERRKVASSLAEMPATKEVPERLLDRLDKLHRGKSDRQQKIQELAQQRRLVRRQAAQQPINRALWSQAIRIEGLAEHGPWITSLQSQIDQLRVDIRTLEAQLGSAAETESDDEQLSVADLPDVSGRVLNKLREPARALREELQRRTRAAEELDESRQQLEQLSAELESELLELGYEQLPAAIEQTGTRVGQLRRVTQLFDQQQRMERQRERLEQEHQQLLEGQVLSGTSLVWLGIPFVFGVMLILGGLWWPNLPALGWPVVLLGVVGWVSAVVAKFALERSASRDLERCEGELGELRERLQEAELELDDLLDRLPHATESPERQLTAAEKELAKLEDLLPKEASVQSARQKVVTIQRRKERLDEGVHELQQEWKSALRRAGLPENLSPRAAKQLAAENQQSGRLRRQLEIRRQELTARERELTKLTEEVEQTAKQAQLSAIGTDPHSQIRRLAAELTEQKTLMEQRRKLREEDRDIRRQGQRLTSQVRRLGQRIEKILLLAGVASEAELRRIVARNRQIAELKQRLQELDTKFETIAQRRCSWEQVEQHLKQVSAADLPAVHKQMTQQLKQLEADLAAANQRRGEIGQQTKALQTNSQRHRVQLMLNSVEHQLRSAVRHWQVLTVADHVLETVRDHYESARQPQALCDASEYFALLTEGKYTRIWTPLGENVLRVDTSDGVTLALDLLSCGTREAVFLSLRLALIADFARRGVVLPLILDDVLVNFDKRRARAAALVLNRFAQSGHQVLLFTCHEHIVELFSDQAAEIRYLLEDEPLEPQLVESSPHPTRIIEFVEEPLTVIAQAPAEPQEEYELADIDEADEQPEEETWDDEEIEWEDEGESEEEEYEEDEMEWELISDEEDEEDEPTEWVDEEEEGEAWEEEEVEEELLDPTRRSNGRTKANPKKRNMKRMRWSGN
jgi:uncharacterized protein YhaN